jgi:hypothetical protein
MGDPLFPQPRWRLPDWFRVDSLLTQWGAEPDAMVTVEAPDLGGESVVFAVLADRTLIVIAEEGDASLAPLADAVEATLQPPYQAHGVRHEGALWGVAAFRIELITLSEEQANHIVLSIRNGETEVTAGEGAGRETLEALADYARVKRKGDCVVDAEQLDGSIWRVRVSPL